MTEKRKLTLYAGCVILCVLVAVLLRYAFPSDPYLESICFLMRPYIYMGIYSAWGISFQKRIIHKEVRSCLMVVAAMMVFWIFIRVCKFEIPHEMPGALRYAWYFYYIPMQVIPAALLYLAFYMRQPENYKLPRKLRFLIIPSLLLMGIVLTNDLHHLVFVFPEGQLDRVASYEVGVYGYGPAYYLIFIWDVCCALVSLIIIFFRCRVVKNKKLLILPFCAYGMAIFYGISYCLNLSFWKLLSDDMTAVFCLLCACVIESCIQCGLIPSNTGYSKLFEASTISAQIVDATGKCCYRAKNAEEISSQMVGEAVEKSLMLENGIRLSGKPIWGGYVLWKESLDQLQKVLRDLEDRREELRDANLIQEENLRMQKQVEKLAIKNQLYDKIQRKTAGQSEILTKYIDEYFDAENEKERKKILGKIVVTGTYIKRCSNLILLGEEKSILPIRELELCFEESVQNLKFSCVEASFFTTLDQIQSELAMEIYVFFEKIIEETLEDLQAIAVYLKAKDQDIQISMTVECQSDLQTIAKEFGAYVERDFDGSYLLSLSWKGGMRHDEIIY